MVATASSNSYTINLPQFVGPFDLLLFFIERDELDINDIPISTVTKNFLEYIRAMEAMNIDLASEFILVAATLMRIKAKMLIPRKEIDEEGNELDPRDELVARLMEYKRYKSVLEEMRFKEDERSLRFDRGNLNRELKSLANIALVDIELEQLSLYSLMKKFQRVLIKLEDRQKKVVHKVYNFSHSIQGQQTFIMSKIKIGEQTSFETLFGNCKNRMHAIITFLALLELLNLQTVTMVNGLGKNNFWLTKLEEGEYDDLPDVDNEDEEEDMDLPSDDSEEEE